MHDDKSDNIFDKDDALDFIIYKELEKQDRERKGGCFGVVTLLLLLPAISIVLLSWK
jgi:hypothetical protein